MERTVLHVAVIDDFNRCFVSDTTPKLRAQVSAWLVQNKVAAPTDPEWALILGEDRYDVDLITPADGWISYYNTDSKFDA